jgi:hypothetical protein
VSSGDADQFLDLHARPTHARLELAVRTFGVGPQVAHQLLAIQGRLLASDEVCELFWGETEALRKVDERRLIDELLTIEATRRKRHVRAVVARFIRAEDLRHDAVGALAEDQKGLSTRVRLLPAVGSDVRNLEGTEFLAVRNIQEAHAFADTFIIFHCLSSRCLA